MTFKLNVRVQVKSYPCHFVQSQLIPKLSQSTIVCGHLLLANSFCSGTTFSLQKYCLELSMPQSDTRRVLKWSQISTEMVRHSP